MASLSLVGIHQSAWKGVPRTLCGLALAGIVGVLTVSDAFGARVAPFRVNIEDGQRGDQIRVFNTLPEARTYRVIAVDVEEHEDGSHSYLAEAGTEPHHAASMLRYAPRQFTLEEGERQPIRIAVRRPADLAEGEYRARLAIQSIPETTSFTTGDADGLSVEIDVTTGVTIPIAITEGAPEGTVDLSGVTVNDNGRMVVNMTREGAASVYGELSVYRGTSPGAEPILEKMRHALVIPLEKLNRAFSDVSVREGEQVHVVYKRIDIDEEAAAEQMISRTVTVGPSS